MKSKLISILTIFLISILPGCTSYAEKADASELKETKTIEKPEVLTRGLNHIGLSVIDLDASVAFFSDVLGWNVVGGYPDYPSKFVTDGNMFVTLWKTTDSESTVAFDRKNNVGLHHLAITVSSFEALDVLHERFLKAENVTIEFAPELNGNGPTKHMMIYEPSGNRLEFAYTPPRN